MTRFHAAVMIALFAPALWSQNSRSSARPLDAGAINAGVYRNSAFGFSYKLPYGWVDRTAEMQDDSPDAGKSRVLLAVFERPPQAISDSINSAVVIAAEPPAAGIKTAAEYFESLSELTTAKGFQAIQEAHEVSVGAARLVRGDFTKPRGPLTMRHTSLVMLENGYAVSFTFIAGSEEEVNQLIEKLSVQPRKPTR